MRFFFALCVFSFFLVSCDVSPRIDKTVNPNNTKTEGTEVAASPMSIQNYFAINSINNHCGIGLKLSTDKTACYVDYSCSSEFECVNVGNVFADELISLFELSNLRDISYNTDSEETPLYNFRVHQNTILSDGNLTPLSLDVPSEFWEDFNWIIPSKYREDITRFQIYDGTWMQSYMIMHDMVNANEWTFAVNKLGFVSAESAAKTYVHEFAHLLSLRSSQVDYYSDFASCDSLYIVDVCVRQDSYLYDFYKEFHEGTTYPDNELFFVSSYAFTNPLEDFADSFMYFIFESSPSRETIRDEKVLFFYNYPEFIEMRNEILSRAVAWLPNSDYFISSNDTN